MGSVVNLQGACGAALMDVSHTEPATVIDASEAALLVQEQQASLLVYNAEAASDPLTGLRLNPSARSDNSACDDSSQDASLAYASYQGLANHGSLEEVEPRPSDFG